MPTVPLQERPLLERAYVALNRRTRTQKRHPVVLLDEDQAALDTATGSRRASVDALSRLQRAGRLQRVRRGVYLLVEPTGSVDADVLRIIDAVTPRPYLVTAGRALAAANLSDQYFFSIIVLTSRRLHPWAWQGNRVRYATVGEAKLWGSRSRDGVQVARPERAVLDSLAQPRWGVTVPQVSEAIDLGLQREALTTEVLKRAAGRYRNVSVARRVGFLVSLVAGPNAAAPFLDLRGSARALPLLAPRGPVDGQVDPTWKIRVNVDPEHLLAHRMTG